MWHNPPLSSKSAERAACYELDRACREAAPQTAALLGRSEPAARMYWCPGNELWPSSSGEIREEGDYPFVFVEDG